MIFNLAGAFPSRRGGGLLEYNSWSSCVGLACYNSISSSGAGAWAGLASASASCFFFCFFCFLSATTRLCGIYGS